MNAFCSFDYLQAHCEESDCSKYKKCGSAHSVAGTADAFLPLSCLKGLNDGMVMYMGGLGFLAELGYPALDANLNSIESSSTAMHFG